jgi:hypothetical protein
MNLADAVSGPAMYTELLASFPAPIAASPRASAVMRDGPAPVAARIATQRQV